MQRRFVRTRPRTFVRRPRNWQWARQAFSDATAVIAPQFAFNDLLSDFKSRMGINLNLPDIVIWRLIIKISMRVSVAPATAISAADAVLLSVFVDTTNQAQLNPVLEPYSEKFMLYDAVYLSEPVFNGMAIASTLPTELMLYRSYDIRVHRKLPNIDETLFITYSPTNAVEILERAVTFSCLLKMGR